MKTNSKQLVLKQIKTSLTYNICNYYFFTYFMVLWERDTTAKEGKWTISSGSSRESAVDNFKKIRALVFWLFSHPYLILFLCKCFHEKF